MKKLVLLSAAILFTSGAVFAAEPLLLEPLSPSILSTTPGAQQVSVDVKNGVYEATYNPQLNSNMVPQNAAAEGKPVPEKRKPRVKIETKQGRRTNTQWNPGGKGTKSFF